MQIFYPGGIIMPALRPLHTVPEGDDRLIQVRARRISHLRRLKERYLPELGDIIEIMGTDYEYRAYCTHEQLAQALAAMALDINYVKSKSQAVEQYNDKELYETNNAVWGTLYRLLSTHKIFSRPRRKNKTQPSDTTQQPSEVRWSSSSDWSWGMSATSLAPTVRDLVGTSVEDDDVIKMVPDSWDAEVPEISRFPNGNIDHSQCAHGQSKAAKRRCTRRANKR